MAAPGRARRSLAGGRRSTPLLSTSANPRATPSIPRVTMKGGIAPLVMRKPLTAPVAAPAERQPRIPTHHGRSRLDVSIAPMTPERASMEPTERSMPADEMTKVIPIARTPKTEVESRMLRMLETERKAFDRSAIATQRTASTISDSSRTAAPPAKRARHDAAAAVVDADVMRPSPGAMAPPVQPGEQAASTWAYFTYWSIGSLFASMTSLVKTRVGT